MQDSASVTSNTTTSSYSGGGVNVKLGGTFTMRDSASVTGNTASSYSSGGGVYVSEGTFTMQGGAISGNTSHIGGGVYFAAYKGTFTKTGGTIYGEDADQSLKNTAISRLGHAIYEGVRLNYERVNRNWRNATAGPTVNTDSSSFWLNDGDGVMFPPDSISGFPW